MFLGWVAFRGIVREKDYHDSFSDAVEENRREKAIAAKNRWNPGMAYGGSRRPQGI
jgi:hypothetical protein